MCDNILEIGRVQLQRDSLMVLELDGSYYGVFLGFAQLNSVNRSIHDDPRFVWGAKKKQRNFQLKKCSPLA